MWRMDFSPWSISNMFLEMQRNSREVLPVMSRSDDKMHFRNSGVIH